MEEENKITQPEEDIKTGEEAKIGDLLQDEEEVVVEKSEPKKKPESVPMSVFLELKKELKELKGKSQEGKVVDSSIEEIAKQYDVDEGFVNKLANAIKTSTVKEFDEKYSTKIKEFEREKITEKNNKVFDDVFEKTLEAMPEMKGIVNKDAIKALAFNPGNSKKTLSQIIEEVYGNTVVGKKTIETAQPVSGSRSEVKVDFTKAGDPAVYAQIKADPELRKQYNEFLIKNLNI